VGHGFSVGRWWRSGCSGDDGDLDLPLRTHERRNRDQRGGDPATSEELVAGGHHGRQVVADDGVRGDADDVGWLHRGLRQHRCDVGPDRRRLLADRLGHRAVRPGRHDARRVQPPRGVIAEDGMGVVGGGRCDRCRGDLAVHAPSLHQRRRPNANPIARPIASPTPMPRPMLPIATPIAQPRTVPSTTPLPILAVGPGRRVRAAVDSIAGSYPPNAVPMHAGAGYRAHVVRLPPVEYVPYHELAGRPNVILDGSPTEGTVVTISHWPGHPPPPEVADDLSAQMAFRML